MSKKEVRLQLPNLHPLGYEKYLRTEDDLAGDNDQSQIYWAHYLHGEGWQMARTDMSEKSSDCCIACAAC
jgi:hypothetical protein